VVVIGCGLVLEGEIATDGTGEAVVTGMVVVEGLDKAEETT